MTARFGSTYYHPPSLVPPRAVTPPPAIRPRDAPACSPSDRSDGSNPASVTSSPPTLGLCAASVQSSASSASHASPAVTRLFIPTKALSYINNELPALRAKAPPLGLTHLLADAYDAADNAIERIADTSAPVPVLAFYTAELSCTTAQDEFLRQITTSSGLLVARNDLAALPSHLQLALALASAEGIYGRHEGSELSIGATIVENAAGLSIVEATAKRVPDSRGASEDSGSGEVVEAESGRESEGQSTSGDSGAVGGGERSRGEGGVGRGGGGGAGGSGATGGAGAPGDGDQDGACTPTAEGSGSIGSASASAYDVDHHSSLRVTINLRDQCGSEISLTIGSPYGRPSNRRIPLVLTTAHQVGGDYTFDYALTQCSFDFGDKPIRWTMESSESPLILPHECTTTSAVSPEVSAGLDLSWPPTASLSVTKPATERTVTKNDGAPFIAAKERSRDISTSLTSYKPVDNKRGDSARAGGLVGHLGGWVGLVDDDSADIPLEIATESHVLFVPKEPKPTALPFGLLVFHALNISSISSQIGSNATTRLEPFVLEADGTTATSLGHTGPSKISVGFASLEHPSSSRISSLLRRPQQQGSAASPSLSGQTELFVKESSSQLFKPADPQSKWPLGS